MSLYWTTLLRKIRASKTRAPHSVYEPYRISRRQNKTFIRCCRKRNNELKTIKQPWIKRLDAKRREHVSEDRTDSRRMIWLRRNSLGDWSSKCDQNPPIAAQQWHTSNTAIFIWVSIHYLREKQPSNLPIFTRTEGGQTTFLTHRFLHCLFCFLCYR